MFLGLDFLGQQDAFDDALFVDDEGGAEGSEILAAVHRLFTPGTEGLIEVHVGVGNEVEGQLVLGDEPLVALLVLDAYAQYLVTLLAELRIPVP